MITSQSANTLLLVRPTNFGFNAQTAENNSFQTKIESRKLQELALNEFNNLVIVLRSAKVNVIVVDDEPQSQLPDAIFPNNWFSTHSDGSFCLYPMFAENRRFERKTSIIEMLKKCFDVEKTVDFTHYETNNKFLEGTGSLVLDRTNHIAYSCLSPRTNEDILDDFCAQLQYEKCCFRTSFEGKEIYHTNVMMTVADEYVIICTQSITNNSERETVIRKLKSTGKEIIEITIDQVGHFAGNMLQISNVDGKLFLAMSAQAYNSLDHKQKQKIKRYNDILYSDISTIEMVGGGSVRCMLAEIFLKQNLKNNG